MKNRKSIVLMVVMYMFFHLGLQTIGAEEVHVDEQEQESTEEGSNEMKEQNPDMVETGESENKEIHNSINNTQDLEVNVNEDDQVGSDGGGSIDQSLSKGMYKEEVKDLKRNLGKLGFPVPGNGTPLFGSDTEKVVKTFQTYFGLQSSGIADTATLFKISEILSSPLQTGERHEVTVQLKADLAKLGFPVPGNGTTLFGNNTAGKVKEFQSYHGLKVSGIADKVTLKRISELLEAPLSNGITRADVKTLKKDLGKLGFQVPGNGTAFFGNETEKKVREFQSYYNLEVTGVVYDTTRLKIKEVLSSPLQSGKKHKDTIRLKKDLALLGFVVPGNGTTLFGKNTAEKVREFQSYYGLKINGIADDVTLSKIREISESPLQSGKNHKRTIQLKTDLAILGYTISKNPTTLYGEKTEKQVRKFQKDYGLPVNGIADALTLKKIDSLIVKVFIDPGHGGKDPGASGYGLSEKNVVLDISLKAAEVLAEKYVGAVVELSRTTDRFIGLGDRSKMANEWGADYFVSIHNNSHTGSANGFESFIYNGKVSNETKNLQKGVHKYLIKQLGVTDRGMKSANFSVLRNTAMPAILLEYLFIDNAKENALLKNKVYRDWLGEITADAIASVLNLKKR